MLGPVHVECEHCEYDWDYNGELDEATCPDCSRKATTGLEKETKEMTLKEVRSWLAGRISEVSVPDDAGSPGHYPPDEGNAIVRTIDKLRVLSDTPSASETETNLETTTVWCDNCSSQFPYGGQGAVVKCQICQRPTTTPFVEDTEVDYTAIINNWR